MARTEEKLSAGIRESDYLGLGLLFDAVPFPAVKDALKANGIQTQRVRKLPLELMVYYVICLSLFARVSMRNVLSCMLEGCTWLHLNASGEFIQSSGAISSTRNRLGWKVMRYLFNQTCVPLSDDDDLFSRYHGLLMLAIDGTCVNLPNEKANSDYFGRQAVAEGQTGFPPGQDNCRSRIPEHGMIGKKEISRFVQRFTPLPLRYHTSSAVPALADDIHPREKCQRSYSRVTGPNRPEARLSCSKARCLSS